MMDRLHAPLVPSLFFLLYRVCFIEQVPRLKPEPSRLSAGRKWPWIATLERVLIFMSASQRWVKSNWNPDSHNREDMEFAFNLLSLAGRGENISLKREKRSRNVL